jgi:hypothetical protein
MLRCCFVSSPVFAVQSNLFNKAELAINVLGVHTQLGEAQLLLQLYAAKGLDMLGMLNGQFAFCLYDSKQVRARHEYFKISSCSSSRSVPLLCWFVAANCRASSTYILALFQQHKQAFSSLLKRL